MQKNNFDFIRFTLAFMVVLAHMIDLSRSQSLLFLQPFFDAFAYISVTGFFVISGFLITKSYISTNDPAKYFVKRAKRLLPAYFFTLTASALLLVFASTLPAHQYFLSADFYKYLFFNAIFLNFIHPCLPGVFSSNAICAINGALWTIKIEVSFYIIVPLLMYIFNRFPKKVLLFFIIYITALLYKLTVSYYYQKTGNGLYTTLEHQLPAFMSYFICGIALHYYLPLFLKYKNYLVAVALPLFIAEHYFSVEILTPAALSIIVFYVAFGFTFFNNFGRRGDISYGIYIYHFPIIQSCVAAGLFTLYNPWLVSLCIVVVVLIVATLSWNLLEERFLKRKPLVISPV